jgi:hypothetical protein
MATHQRFTRSLLSAACICLTLAISSLVHSQATADATQQEQIVQPAPQSPTNGSQTLKEDWLGQQAAYASFSMEIAGEELNAQSDIQEGKDSTHYRVNYSNSLHIREDEEQAMRTILFDAWSQTSELDKQIMANHQELHRNFSPELAAKREALLQRRPKIIEEAIAKLKQELGAEGFQKLDANVYQILGRRPTTGSPYPVGASNPQHVKENPAQEQTPSVPRSPKEPFRS